MAESKKNSILASYTRAGSPHIFIRPYRGVGAFYKSAPNKRLRDIIIGYHQLERPNNTSEPALFSSETCTTLTFYCGPHRPFAYFAGPMSRPLLFSDIKPGIYFCIIFSPAQMFKLFHIPLKELANRYVFAGDIMGHEGQRLLELTVEARSFQERVTVVERYLQIRTSKIIKIPHAWIYTAIFALSSNPNEFSDERLAFLSGFSKRHTRNLFYNYVGLSPKMYRRITRTKMMMHNICMNPAMKHVDLAMESGFYDQSHMIKELKYFHGTTPSRLLTEFSSFR